MSWIKGAACRHLHLLALRSSSKQIPRIALFFERLSGLETGKKKQWWVVSEFNHKKSPCEKVEQDGNVLLVGERSDPLNDQLTGIPLNTIDRDAHTTQKAIAPDQRPSLIMASIFDPDKQTHRCVDRPKLMTPTWHAQRSIESMMCSFLSKTRGLCAKQYR